MLFSQITEILDPEPHTAALNMALDEALLQHAAGPTLRIYRWLQPAVSFGYFGKFATAHRAAEGRDLVRRWTGGGLVEHGTDLTYTLIVPRDAAFFRLPALESYRLIHEQIASWLAALGIKASVAASAMGGTSAVCFTGHVRHDVVTEGAKLAGAAQRRTRWGMLHQGSIQVPASNGGQHRIPQNGSDLANCFAGEVQQTNFPSTILESAQQIARDKYAAEEWLRKF